MSIPIIGTILEAGLRIIEKVIPDPQAKAAAQLKLLELQQAGEFKALEADLAVMLAQAEINKVEASDPSTFKSGWRPAVGWVCVSGLVWTYIALPVLSWLSLAQGWPVPPNIETSELMILLGSLLGFGGMRSLERIKGKS